MSQLPAGQMSSGCVVLAVALLALHCFAWRPAAVLLLAAEGLQMAGNERPLWEIIVLLTLIVLLSLLL